MLIGLPMLDYVATAGFSVPPRPHEEKPRGHLLYTYREGGSKTPGVLRPLARRNRAPGIASLNPGYGPHAGKRAAVGTGLPASFSFKPSKDARGSRPIGIPPSRAYRAREACNVRRRPRPGYRSLNPGYGPTALKPYTGWLSTSWLLR